MRVGVLAVALLLAAGGPPTPAGPPAWVDTEVSFAGGGTTVHGTLRHPASTTTSVPAVLLIAGSGPTDRNGDSRGAPGPFGTLAALAGWFGDHGVATLRYDKLGSGATGVGPYADEPATIGVDVFTRQAAAAWAFLAAAPGVDRDRLGVVGHSEGALFALLLATRPGSRPAGSPPVHALGLLEPLSRRYLDVLAEQVTAQLDAAAAAGALPAAQIATLRTALASAVTSLRAGGTVPPGLPPALAPLFAAQNARFLTEADRLDPAELAAALPAGTPVLLSCSDADIQVSCTDVARLAGGLAAARADVWQVTLQGVDHVLKEDGSRTAAHYGDPLPFSARLRTAVGEFAARHLTG